MSTRENIRLIELLRFTVTVLGPTANSRIQGLFEALEWHSSIFKRF